MRISSQVASLTAQHGLTKSQRSLEVSMQQLASGSRFANAGVDAAGQAISDSMQAQIKGYGAAAMNAQNAQGLVEHAEGALNEQNNILIRLRELAVQAASDTYSENERTFLNFEFTQLTSELDRIAKTTSFGSQKLLDGSDKNYEFQVGINSGSDNIITYTQDANTTASSLGMSGASVEDQSSAKDSLDSIDGALQIVGSARAKLGAVQSRLNHAVDANESQRESLISAHSKMADTDVAQAVSEVRRLQVLQQYQIAMLAISNENDVQNLKLIG